LKRSTRDYRIAGARLKPDARKVAAVAADEHVRG
jgi:hypothetical protein